MSAVRSNQKADSPVSTLPLSGIGVGMDHVVGRDAVGGDHQQPVAEVVHLADLAPADEVRPGSVGGSRARHEPEASDAAARGARGSLVGEPVEPLDDLVARAARTRPGSKTRVEVERPGARRRPGRLEQLAERRAARPRRAGRPPARSGRRRRARRPGLDQREQRALASTARRA